MPAAGASRAALRVSPIGELLSLKKISPRWEGKPTSGPWSPSWPGASPGQPPPPQPNNQTLTKDLADPELVDERSPDRVVLEVARAAGQQVDLVRGDGGQEDRLVGELAVKLRPPGR